MQIGSNKPAHTSSSSSTKRSLPSSDWLKVEMNGTLIILDSFCLMKLALRANQELSPHQDKIKTPVAPAQKFIVVDDGKGKPISYSQETPTPPTKRREIKKIPKAMHQKLRRQCDMTGRAKKS